MKTKRNSGQTLVETALVLPLLASFLIPAIVSIIHFLTLKFLAQHQLYEFLVCQEIRLQERNCEMNFRKISKIYLVGAELKQFYFHKNNNLSQADVILDTWYIKKIKIHEQIQLPLH